MCGTLCSGRTERRRTKTATPANIVRSAVFAKLGTTAVGAQNRRPDENNARPHGKRTVTTMAERWTDEQKSAINEKGRNIIVSAAAGSGKTSVLSERVCRFVADGGDIERLLVVTFTKPASKEMRSPYTQKKSPTFCRAEQDPETKTASPPTCQSRKRKRFRQ